MPQAEEFGFPIAEGFPEIDAPGMAGKVGALYLADMSVLPFAGGDILRLGHALAWPRQERMIP